MTRQDNSDAPRPLGESLGGRRRARVILLRNAGVAGDLQADDGPGEAPWNRLPIPDSPQVSAMDALSAAIDGSFRSEAGEDPAGVSISGLNTFNGWDERRVGQSDPTSRAVFRLAINHLENLTPIALREPSMVSAYLALIFALPDRAVVNASLGERVLSRIDERFLQALDAVQSSGTPNVASAQAAPFDHRQASILSAYLFIAAIPSEAFSASGAFDTVAWQRFIATSWRCFGVAVPRGDVDAVRNVRQIDHHASFVRNVSSWAAEPSHADENRAEAALLILMCNEDGQTALDLSYLGLHSLPAALWLLDRPGSACRAAGGLRSLRLNDNCLKKLPESVGQLRHLRKLSMSRNHLLSLPATLGELSELTSLHLSDNEISALPSSVGKLTDLQSLLADGCLLTSLPEELVNLSHLKEIDLDDNLLTSLPNGLAHLPDTCIVRLFDNPLSNRVRRALTVISDGPVCLVSDVGMGAETEAETDTNAGTPEMVDAKTGSAAPSDVVRGSNVDDDGSLGDGVQGQRGLTEAAFDWLDLSAHRTADATKRWRALEVMPNASALATVLDRLATLSEATNWNTRIAFRHRVTALLLNIVERPALGRVCLGLARDALARGDTARACLVRLEALVADDQAQHLGLPLSEILTLSLRRFRLHVIDRVVRDQLIHRPFTDESDLRLAYRHALSTRVDLGLDFLDPDQPRDLITDSSAQRQASTSAMTAHPVLPTPTSSAVPAYNGRLFLGTAPDLIRLSADEISAALDALSESEAGEEVVSFLIDYAPWRAGICRQEHAHFEALMAQFDREDEAVAGDDTAKAVSEAATSAELSSAQAASITARRHLKASQAARFSAQLALLTAARMRA